MKKSSIHNRHMITVTESIEYFFEVDYDAPDNLQWEDLTEHPKLYEQITAKMNGDYACDWEITIDDCRLELDPVLTRTSEEEPTNVLNISNQKQGLTRRQT